MRKTCTSSQSQGKNKLASYQCQGKWQTTWRIAKLVSMLTTRNTNPNICAHGIVVFGVIEEYTAQSGTG